MADATVTQNEGMRRSPPAGTARLVIGLDLGGSKLRGAIGDRKGAVLAEFDQPTQGDSADAVLQQIAGMTTALLAQAGAYRKDLAALTLGVPGVVDPQGRVVLSPHVVFDAARPLATLVSEVIGVPVSVENDGNLSAYGELSISPLEDGRSIAFMAIGTGVGMGLIVEGQLIRGRHGAAGEMAFLPHGADPFALAATHPTGGYEAVIGSRAISAAYARLGGDAISVRAIFERAETGEARARRVVDDLIANIAIGLSAVVALLDPGRIVLGGGIGARPGVADAVGAALSRLIAVPCSVKASRLGSRAGVVGALAFARTRADQLDGVQQ